VFNENPLFFSLKNYYRNQEIYFYKLKDKDDVPAIHEYFEVK